VPEPPRSSIARQALRGVIVGAAAILLAVFATPQVLRGARLARVIKARMPPLCGRLDLASARLGSWSIVQLLTGRPFPVEIEGLEVVDPSGREVLRSARITARVDVDRRLRRVAILDARIGPGRWQMLSDETYGVSLAAAFASPDHCGPAPAHAPRAARAPGAAQPFELVIDHVEFQGMTVVLDFPDWGLTLANASAQGGLRAASGPVASPGFTFSVTDVRAGPGSALRVGAPHLPWAADLPFNDIVIARAATSPAQPRDLVLDVARAATGRAVLAGTSTFHGVFGHVAGGAGIDVDTRWTQFADAAAALRAGWRPIIASVMGTEEFDLSATAHGPFSGLSAHFQALADQMRLGLSITPDLHIEATLDLSRFETTSRLPRPMRPMLGGIANGHVRLEAKLSSRLAAVSGSLAAVDLRLDRAQEGPLPRRWRVHTGSMAREPPPPRPDQAPSLDVTIGEARLAGGLLDLRAAGVIAGGGTLEGVTTLALVDRRSHRRLADPVVNTDLAFTDVDLGQMLSSPIATNVTGHAAITGTSDDLRLRVQLERPRSIVVAGMVLSLPTRLAARLRHGDLLIVPPTTLGGPGGARLEAKGSMIMDRRVDADLVARDWRLEDTPLPSLLPGRWAGVFQGTLHAWGNPHAPSLSGTVDVRDVVAAGAPLGDGHVSFAQEAPGPRGDLLLEAQLGPHLHASGRLQPADGALTVDAQVEELPLTPWLRRLSPQALATISGGAALSFGPARPLEARAFLSRVHLGWGRTIAVDNRDVVRLRATAGSVVLEPALFTGSGLSLTAAGRLEGTVVDGKVEGTAALATVAALLPPLPVRLGRFGGDLEVRAHAEGPLAAPAIDAGAFVREPLALSVLRVGHPALPVAVSSGRIWISTAPNHLPDLRVERLALSTPGARLDLGGTAALDAHDPWGSAGQWSGSAALEAGALARLVPRLIGHAEGQLAITARVDGSPRRGRWQGSLETTPVALIPRGSRDTLSLTPIRADFDDRRLRVAPFGVSLGALGQIRLGAPAEVQLRTLYPPALDRLDVTLSGSGLELPRPLAGVRFDDGALDLHLMGPDGGGRFVLAGRVSIPRAGYAPAPEEHPSLSLGGKNGSTLDRLVRRLWLDLTVHVRDFRVAAPGPDLTLAVDCRLQGPLSGLTTSGRIRGRNVYSGAALLLSDMFSSRHLRECRK
jgi:hypothetical protein